jgi:hypothetical protein
LTIDTFIKKAATVKGWRFVRTALRKKAIRRNKDKDACPIAVVREILGAKVSFKSKNDECDIMFAADGDWAEPWYGLKPERMGQIAAIRQKMLKAFGLKERP